MSRSDSSKPRISGVMPTIDVMPIDAEDRQRRAHLVGAQRVERHHGDFAPEPRLRPLLTSQRLDRIERCRPRTPGRRRRTGRRRR